MKDILEIIKGLNDLYSEGGAQTDEIPMAENDLGLKFADEYQDYLTRYGCISFGSHEMTGLSKQERLNVVHVTIKNRNYNKKIPRDFYVIEELNIDGIVIWQNSEGTIFMTFPNTEPRLIHESLSEYYESISDRIGKNG